MVPLIRDWACGPVWLLGNETLPGAPDLNGKHSSACLSAPSPHSGAMARGNFWDSWRPLKVNTVGEPSVFFFF